MENAAKIFIGKGKVPVTLNLKYANRHGLIAGATGTGKTVTLQILAEGFSQQGVPVFMADIKGDLSGISQAGTMKGFLEKRAADIELDDYSYHANPVVLWDLYGKQGHPVRTTVAEVGPLLLAQLLELNDTQEGVLQAAFKIADDQEMLLLDLKDLRSLLNYISEQASELSANYGNMSKSSIGAIQRRLLALDEQGGGHFFGEPALDVHEFIRVNADGRGHINLLAADKLMLQPKLYATFLLWLLTQLFKQLPEVGDAAKPKLVFFFDEAHLLFDDAPKALLYRVEQVVRLIRSKGVGIYFVTQNPADIPDDVLGQLGNRVQHALRAFTPRDQKAVKVAAQTFRANPDFETSQIISELGVGEALVSTLAEKGVPTMVERTLIRPPASRLGPITVEERAKILTNSFCAGRYDVLLDRESAHEQLQARASKIKADQEKEVELESQSASKKSTRSSGRQRQGIVETMAKSVVRSVGSSFGRKIARSLMKSLFGR